MPDRIFLTSDRCENEHRGAPDKNERLWDPDYATPQVRDGNYKRSKACYASPPSDVWKKCSRIWADISRPAKGELSWIGSTRRERKRGRCPSLVEQKAYQEGWHAFLNGVELSFRPNYESADLRLRWFQGYEDSQHLNGRKGNDNV